MNKTTTIIAPGRICLFGDHQDYLGLPVIACAINREVVLSSEENNSAFFNISMPDIKAERVIGISETFEILEKGDFFGSALRVVRRYGCIPDKGFNILLKSTIPINAGVSSSSAIVVAWIHFLLNTFGSNHDITNKLIAKLAYEAEVIEHNSPGGKMDQYTISLGNIIYIDTSEDSTYNIIGTTLNGLILAESGVPKETIGLLAKIRQNAEDAISQVKSSSTNFNLVNVTLDESTILASVVSEELYPYFYAAVKNHSITQKALQEFKKKPLNHKTIGKLMNEHHNVLRNLLKITVPLIDAMISAALNAGAYGAKIVGSGGGGSIVALAPVDKKEAIIQAIIAVGAKKAYEVSVTEGTHTI